METATDQGVWERYGRFLREPPELSLTWEDPESEARGYLVLNSTHGGAAGGGTRMRVGLPREEVVYLAKAMELKFAISGPPIGGAKAGLAFDPDDPRKEAVLRRWFTAVRPLLQSCYGTAGDLNVDGAREVGPLCSEVGLGHPQEGVARAHLGLEGAALERRLEVMRAGLNQPVAGDLGLTPGRPGPAGTRAAADGGLTVYDLITGYGVARGTLRLMRHLGMEPGEARVLLEGFGAVGGSAGLYLSRAGTPIVGIVDARGGLVEPEGLDAADVEELLRHRRRGLLPESIPRSRKEADRERFRRIDAEVIVCAAASGTVDRPTLDRLSGQGVELLVSGANRPFASDSPGDTAMEREADRRLTVLPDVVANCGAARAFYHQMTRDEVTAPEEVFDAVRRTVEEGVDELVRRAGGPERGLLAAALEMTLDRVEASRDAGGSPE